MPRSKVKFAIRMAPETQQLIREWFPKDNRKTQSEYIEKAIRFYTGYISSGDAASFLSDTLMAALRAAIQNSETRTGRLLFKLAVEVNMMTKVFAMGLKIDPKNLEQLRGRCVREVKSSNGMIFVQGCGGV